MLGEHLIFAGPICNEIYIADDHEVYIRPGGPAYRAACAVLALRAQAAIVATTPQSLDRECLDKFKKSEVRIYDQLVTKGQENALVFDLRSGAGGEARPISSLGNPARPPMEFIQHHPFRNLHVHIGALPVAAMEGALSVAQGVAPAASFSCSLYEPHIQEDVRRAVRVATSCRIVLMSMRELRYLGDSEALAEVLSNRLVVVTCGEAGAICFVDGIPVFAHSPAKRKAVCTTGFDDVFAGAFLASLLSSREVARALVLGCEVAAASLHDYGADEVLQARHSIRQLEKKSGLFTSAPRIPLLAPRVLEVEPGFAYEQIVEATGLFVLRENRLLLVNKPDDKAFVPGVLYIPGGKLEAGESPEQCARRELREETGLEGGNFEMFSVCYYQHPKKPGLLYRFYQFLITGTTGEPVPRDDISACAWRAVNELKREELFDLTWVQLFVSDLLRPFRFMDSP